ncbi:MAG TPA: asparaginase [Vicinamibacteria bacterium]|nr:asparaginase [Vicinamibacteria bacterium]
MTRRPRVHVLFTGGTISMKIDPATGAAVPALSGEEIVAHVTGLRDAADLVLEDYARLPGPHVTPHWMWRLRERIAAVAADPAVDGIVVTHGTDTLEETAFLVDLTTATPKPIVFCGAMRTISDAGWDGPANLMAAVRTAARADARERGVLVIVGPQVHAASEATKFHTQSLAAFRSPAGPLATVESGTVRFRRAAFRPPVLTPRRLVTEVDLHTMVAGSDEALLRASLARGARGLVLEATGAGNVPPTAMPAVRAALAAGVVVVVVSRCAEGSVAPLYGYEGGGQALRQLGVILGGELPGPKARIKLMVVLGTTSDPAEVRRHFEDGPSPARE